MTRSRVSGRSRRRAPSAWATALPIAATVGPPRRLADAERRLVGHRVDQLDRHLGHLAEAQHRVALPVARADPGGVEPHAFLQGPAGRLDDAALELVDRAVRVDDEAGIGGAPDAQQADGFVDLDLGDDRGIGGEVLVAGEADAAAAPGAGRCSRLPAAHRATACSTTARARGSDSIDSR